MSQALPAASWLCGALLACQGLDRPPAPGEGAGDRSDAGRGYLEIPTPLPPEADAGGFCGNQIIPVIVERPNLYFILDASGSMNLPMEEGSYLPTRYGAAHRAIATVLRRIGHRVRFGAAIFPPPPREDVFCEPGEEVFSTRTGDPVSYAVSGTDGPNLRALLATLARRHPSGMTPTALTVDALTEKLAALQGDTYAFLLTDGAPNCGDPDARCDISTCGINVEGQCDDDMNCCSPVWHPLAPLWCVDDAPTEAAIARLAERGVKTFVVGMPGTEVYEAILNRHAIAGGTARPEPPHYYPVQSADELAETLTALGAGVAVSCTVELDEIPPAPELVNVYFDHVVIPLDPEDGWRWQGERTVEVVGPHCQLLQSGQVLQLQIVAGCPTVIR